MPRRAGQMRHRLEIQQKVSDRDGAGQPVESWQTVTGFEAEPASIEFLSGRDYIAADARQSEVTARIQMNYRPGVVAGMRAISSDGRVFRIHAVLPDPKMSRWQTLMVSEGRRSE